MESRWERRTQFKGDWKRASNQVGRKPSDASGAMQAQTGQFQEEERVLPERGHQPRRGPRRPRPCRQSEWTAACGVSHSLTEIQKRAEQLWALPSSGSSRPCIYKPRRTAAPDGHRDSGPAVTLLGHVQRSRTHTPGIKCPPQDHAAGGPLHSQPLPGQQRVRTPDTHERFGERSHGRPLQTVPKSQRQRACEG